MEEENNQILSEDDLAELQRQLAFVDLLSKDGHSGNIEFSVMVLDYTKIRIRPERNHQRPHFHIEYKQEHVASYAIDSFERLAGYMPKKYEKKILDWAKSKQKSLEQTWKKLQAGEDVRELILVKEES